MLRYAETPGNDVVFKRIGFQVEQRSGNETPAHE